MGSAEAEGTELYPNRWAQIPPNGKHCPYTGLGHSRLYQLLDGIGRKHIRVASIRDPKAARGTRLYHLGDMLRFLDQLAAERSNKGGKE
jgi:hypothetical protein